MSDCVSQAILPQLLDEIIKRHWEYLDAEESIEKLEQRKKLEDNLKEYLCIVQHDRKFLLPETARVLANSIRDLDDFSAQKAITAFEAISQYANNLFTRPWRKEFRILKMYSGFYQHEIKSNLLDAEKLFEGMGYRRISEDTLILDGPICPDQVTNISRDAMIAYVELQIIKHIYTSLDAIGISCSWLDIYRYREKHTGGTSQAVKDLAYTIEEKRYRSRQKAMTSDNYGYIDVQPSPNYFSPNSQFCPAQCQCHMYQQVAPAVNRQRSLNQTLNGSLGYLPDHRQHSTRTSANLVYSNMNYPTQQHYHGNHQLQDSGGMTLSQMSHSRSLEHYSEPSNQNHNNILPHRHSFDHQQQGCTARQHHTQQQSQQQHYYQHVQNHQPQQNLYESTYDCIDGNSLTGGGSSISYAAVAANAVVNTGGSAGINCNLNTNSAYSQPYNVSGNRFPLPFNISNQISAYDNLPAPTTSYMTNPQEPAYAHIAEQHLYSSVSKLPQNCVKNSTTNIYNPNSTFVKRSCPNDQLINFEDLTPQQQVDQYRPTYDSTSNYIMEKRFNVTDNPLPQPFPTNCQQHYGTGKPSINDDVYVYAKPLPRENRKPMQNASNIRKLSYNTIEKGDTTDISYESANDDFNNLTGTEYQQSHHSHSPTQLTKNQDGVGSFENWSYVYKNLEKSGYSKDLGEREDFLVQSLDLDSLNINNDTSPSQSSSAEKRRSNYAGNDKGPSQQQQQQQSHLETKQKTRTFENLKCSTKNNSKMEILASASSSQKSKISIDNNASKKIKSSLKQHQQQQLQTNATSKPNNTNNSSSSNNINQQPNKPNNQTKINDNKSTTTNRKTMNNNNNIQDSLTNSCNGGTTQSKKSAGNSSKKSLSSKNSTNTNITSTQIIVTSDNEWSCDFCTFLNPNTKRICEMCSKTKDFKMMDATISSSSSTGAGSKITHNTTTCA